MFKRWLWTSVESFPELPQNHSTFEAPSHITFFTKTLDLHTKSFNNNADLTILTNSNMIDS